jgi:hypothetical protein
MFWKIRTGEKHFELVTAEDRGTAREKASDVFEEQFEDNGYLFAAFNEVYGALHKEQRR